MEKIYTIPVNESFEACMAAAAEDAKANAALLEAEEKAMEAIRNDDTVKRAPDTGLAAQHTAECPFCRLYAQLEENELDLILGASMMEPDVRIKTNAKGFCRRHLEMMFTRKNRLGMALMLESHLDETRRLVEKGDFKNLDKLEHDCYVCERIEYQLSKMIENAVLLWDEDYDFREKLAAQPYICIPHTRRWLEMAKHMLNRKKFGQFSEALLPITLNYYDSLSEDVSWFVKKFDYRYEKEPWGTAKDAVERAIKFLR